MEDLIMNGNSKKNSLQKEGLLLQNTPHSTGPVNLENSSYFLLNQAKQQLKSLDAELLLAHCLGIERSALLGQLGNLELTLKQRDAFLALVARRVQHEPLAYITGMKEFWSLPFYVTPATLIPRPDSETLIEVVIKKCKNKQQDVRILDLGTGSGCLLLTLLSEYPNATGIGVDLSPAALETASRNACNLGLEKRTAFRLQSWGKGLNERFGIIVCNPPYVRQREASTLAPEVMNFEPHTALFGGEDGLDCYHAIAPDIARLLAPEGLAFLEIGIGQEREVAEIMTAQGLEITDEIQDLTNRIRCLVVGRK